MPRRVGVVAAVAFVGTVWLANWLLAKYGTVSVGFGLEAPAGVYAAGIAFALRDLVHRTLGRAAVVWCIAAGCLLAYLISDGTIPGGQTSIAVASAAAFLFSELSDLAIYTPVAGRSFTAAVVASNTVGAVVDSVIFLWLALGSLALLPGQVVGKWWMTVAVLPVLLVTRRATRAWA